MLSVTCQKHRAQGALLHVVLEPKILEQGTDRCGQAECAEFVAESPKKPIRVFFQDGKNDSRHPTQPINDSFFQNVRLVRALTDKGYDVNYSWGINKDGQRQGGAIFPEMMRWLWRDHPISLDPNDMVERSLRAPFVPAAGK